MSVNKLKKLILDNLSCVTFSYKGKSCGIDPFSLSCFDIWYGEESKTVDSIEKVMSTPIFDGKPLNEIIGNITEFDY